MASKLMMTAAALAMSFLFLSVASDDAYARKNFDSPNSGFCPAGTAPLQGCGRARNVKNCTHANYVRNGCAAKGK
jgi:hypothetical protein